jgi:hypothetical protein
MVPDQPTFARERQIERIQSLLVDLRIAITAAGVSVKAAEAVVHAAGAETGKAIAAADAARNPPPHKLGRPVTGRMP